MTQMSEKKQWVSPTVEELGIDQTLGGQFGGLFENEPRVGSPGVFVGNVGTVPGTRGR